MNSHTSAEWWGARRLQYNFGLILSGILAFLAYVIIGSILFSNNSDFEITIFTTFIQGIGYLVMMGIANIFYCMGSISERVIRPSNPERYRNICYRCGFVFSVLLPFAVPVLMVISNSFSQQSRRTEQAKNELVMISNAVESFRNEWNMYPEEGQSATDILVTLSTPILGGGPLLLNLWQGKNETPKDPWGREYCMESGNWERPPRFYSAGPNGIDERLRPDSDDIGIPPNRNTQQ